MNTRRLHANISWAWLLNPPLLYWVSQGILKGDFDNRLFSLMPSL